MDEHLRMYVDFDAVQGWGPDGCSQVLLHEVGHLFAQHAEQFRDHGIPQWQVRVWNVAADASLNDDLVQAGCDFIATTGVTPATLGQPDHLTPLDYYRALTAGRDDQARSGDSGDRGGEGNGRETADQDPYAGCGSGSGGAPAPWELDPEDDLNGAAPAAGSAELNRALLSTAAEIVEHAAKARGTVPGALGGGVGQAGRWGTGRRPAPNGPAERAKSTARRLRMRPEMTAAAGSCGDPEPAGHSAA